MIEVRVEELKKTVAKLNGTIIESDNKIEKSKINPKSGWIELESRDNGTVGVKVGNYDYYLEASIPFEQVDEEGFHATVTAETFVPLVSKLETECVEISERLNALILTTKNAEYTFPIIKELGKVKSIDAIAFNPVRCIRSSITGAQTASIADTNAKGLMDSLFSKDVQQFVYVDNDGALTSI